MLHTKIRLLELIQNRAISPILNYSTLNYPRILANTAVAKNIRSNLFVPGNSPLPSNSAKESDLTKYEITTFTADQYQEKKKGTFLSNILYIRDVSSISFYYSIQKFHTKDYRRTHRFSLRSLSLPVRSPGPTKFSYQTLSIAHSTKQQ